MGATTDPANKKDNHASNKSGNATIAAQPNEVKSA